MSLEFGLFELASRRIASKNATASASRAVRFAGGNAFKMRCP